MGSAGSQVRESGTVAPARDGALPFKTLRTIAPIGALLLIVVGFYWKLTLTYEFEWFWGPDLAGQVLPWFEEEARQVRHSHLPLWDPHSWGGQPMLGQGQPGAAYPLNWLLFLMPRTNGHIDMVWLAWYYVAIHFMAALFCYLLCRDLGLSPIACLAGALVFSFGAYVGAVEWPQMVNGAVWAPLVFLFLLRAIRGYRPLASAALCGLFWGMSWLSGHHQVPLFISLAAGLTWAYYAARERSWRLAALGATAVVFMFCTAAVQLLPAQEYGKQAKRWVSAAEPVTWNQPVPYLVHQMFSFSPQNAFGIVLPALPGPVDPFIGIAAFSLAIIAVVAAWTRPEVKLFAALALGGFAYALGANNVFQGVFYALVPLVEKARTPAMATVIFGFGAAMLAAFGVEQLRTPMGAVWARRAGWTVIGVGLFVSAVALCILVGNAFAIPTDNRFGMLALLAVLAGALLLAWSRRALSPQWAAALLLALLVMELGSRSGYLFADRNDAKRMATLHSMWRNQDVAAYLSAQPKPMRVEVDTDELAPNWPEYYNLDEMRSALASITANETDPEMWSWQTRSLFNVRYTIGRTPKMPGAKTVFEGEDGMKVFDNPNAFPRAWAVHEVVTLPTIPEQYTLVRDHLDQLHLKAFEARPSGVHLSPCAAADSVTVTRSTPDRVDMDAAMGCDGMVVLSDTFYPGWKATVDKHPADIHEVNFAMRGVVVPRGAHHVEYRYRPASVYIGGILSVLGIAAAGLLAFFYRERRSPIDLSGKSRNNQE